MLSSLKFCPHCLGDDHAAEDGDCLASLLARLNRRNGELATARQALTRVRVLLQQLPAGEARDAALAYAREADR